MDTIRIEADFRLEELAPVDQLNFVNLINHYASSNAHAQELIDKKIAEALAVRADADCIPF